MYRVVQLVLLTVCLAAAIGCDRSDGKAQGKADALIMRKELGKQSAELAGMAIVSTKGKIKSHKSSSWNEGYREGFLEEATK